MMSGRFGASSPPGIMCVYIPEESELLGSFEMTTIMSFSSPSLDCTSIVRALITNGLSGDVTTNTSATDAGTLEVGCRAIICSSDMASLRKVFDTVRQSHSDVECAHVRRLSEPLEGCIWNVMCCDDSKCPHARRRTEQADRPE